MIRYWQEDTETEIGRPFDLEKHDEEINDKWLAKVKQANKEMTAYIELTTGQWTSGFNNGINTCIEILDKLIESEKTDEKLDTL